MKEKYRAMLAEMLEDMQRYDRTERAMRHLAETMRALAESTRALAAEFDIIAEAVSHFAADCARDNAISEPEKRIETQDAEVTAYSENVPSIEELFRQLQEMACDHVVEREKRHPHEFAWTRIPHKIVPNNVRHALYGEAIRHRARDMLPN